MTDARTLVAGAAARLTRSGVPSAEVDAVLLVAHAWSCPAAEVRRAMVLRQDVPAAVEETLDGLLGERCRRVPLQHLTGRAPFRHLELHVGPGVFVPRPETELLVDLALPALPHGGVVVDLCTGSGALAFAVKQERPDAYVYAVELSEHAVSWARRNRDELGLEVCLEHGPAQSAFGHLDGQADVVVSNPPYVPQDMVPVDPEVRDHDPEQALYGGGSDGLRIPLEVATAAARLLRPRGLLVMEHAESQGASLPAGLHRQDTWDQIEDHPDLSGRPRATTARRRG